MAVSELDTLPRVARPPRAMAWVVLMAAAAAVLAVGVAATLIVFSNLGGAAARPPSRFWLALAGSSILTVGSIALRSLRWIFLLRRADTRIPIRDAYIGYFSGFSLLFAPLLAGEMAVRAWVHRARGGVPVQTTLVVNVWERLLDLAALSMLAAVAGLASGGASTWSYALGACALLSLVTPLRRIALTGVAAAAAPVARTFDDTPPAPHPRLADLRTWSAALAASVVAWLLPAAGLWLLARGPRPSISLLDALHTYAASATASILTLAPGGILVAGRQMLSALHAHGYADEVAVWTVLGVRLSTVGVSVAVGAIFALMHLRTRTADSATHFDDIADAYDVQIPESRRHALLLRKTALMKAVIDERGIGARGLDVGCGQGAYVGRMRTLGFEVEGIDMSAGQVRLAARNVGGEGVVRVGSVLDIPAADAAFDFLYVINVLHHLNTVDEQRRAFRELLRVLKPGGLLFIHEINTRNILFRFYMGYVFPSLNCIDEGVERWLLAHKLDGYTDAPVVDVRYFTFLPDFVPAPLVRLLSPLERFLERSSARVFSAHYMAVLRKP
ncbi:MAG TPA: methyltransferase domain-containing protein [Vicinamibacterales bacterium]|nr:methyltransferase domain-containing protein [Vicinamibacterales bacterium]